MNFFFEKFLQFSNFYTNINGSVRNICEIYPQLIKQNTWHFSISVSWYSSVSWLSYNQFTTRISTRNLVGKYSRVRPVHVKFFQGCEKSLARHEYSDKRVYLYTFLARYLLVNYREKARSVLKYRVVSSSVFFHIFFIF